MDKKRKKDVVIRNMQKKKEKSEDSPRLTSRCPLPVCSSWSCHQNPAAAARKLRQTVREPHHKVDPCPPQLCTAGQLTISSSEPGENEALHIRQKCALLSCVSLRARPLASKVWEILAGFPALWGDAHRGGGGGGRGGACCAACDSLRVRSLRPHLTQWGRDPLGEPLLLIPVDLHSCLQRSLATPRWCWWDEQTTRRYKQSLCSQTDFLIFVLFVPPELHDVLRLQRSFTILMSV